MNVWMFLPGRDRVLQAIKYLDGRCGEVVEEHCWAAEGAVVDDLRGPV